MTLGTKKIKPLKYGIDVILSWFFLIIGFVEVVT
jgi:hypothetical protein